MRTAFAMEVNLTAPEKAAVVTAIQVATAPSSQGRCPRPQSCRRDATPQTATVNAPKANRPKVMNWGVWSISRMRRLDEPHRSPMNASSTWPLTWSRREAPGPASWSPRTLELGPRSVERLARRGPERPTAVDGHRLPGDVGGPGARQKQHRFGHLIRLSDAAHRDQLQALADGGRGRKSGGPPGERCRGRRPPARNPRAGPPPARAGPPSPPGSTPRPPPPRRRGARAGPPPGPPPVTRAARSWSSTASVLRT